ncbi:MAG: hypothetical protein HGGPFJEG_00689 [Ignavibacteria bacterium]|nr:hypothetical protein [Ignavibacteria bacterium]
MMECGKFFEGEGENRLNGFPPSLHPHQKKIMS